jgi:hypothetical protein
VTAVAALERPDPVVRPAFLRQHEAAAYLGVSVRWFRDNVDVAPVTLGRTKPGRKPLLRYAVTDLDAWVVRCASFRLTRKKAAR